MYTGSVRQLIVTIMVGPTSHIMQIWSRMDDVMSTWVDFNLNENKLPSWDK